MAAVVSQFTEKDKESELYKYIMARHDNEDKSGSKDVQEFYNRNASYYDECMKKVGCVSQINAARELAKYLKEINCPKDTRILDVGAGTGSVGQMLKEHSGYTNIVAMDISLGMLEEAKKKDVYNEFIYCDLNNDDMEKYYKQFDHAISIGCFILGVLVPETLDKMARFVKPGGLVCISFREKNLENEKLGYKQKLEEMQAKGVWKEISRIVDGYLPMDKEEQAILGCYMVFQVC